MSWLVGDIGGTNARFAIADVSDGRHYRDEANFVCSEFDSAEEAIFQFIGQVAEVPEGIEGIVLAVAGPVIAGDVQLTNNHWSLSSTYLSKVCQTKVSLVNDFEAIAYSLPLLNREYTRQVGGPAKRDLSQDCNVCVLGPGTGLGAAGLVRRKGWQQALVTEAGHGGFAPETSLQMEVLKVMKVLQSGLDRVSVERLVSGSGIGNLYQAMAAIGGYTAHPLTPAEIFEAARQGKDPAVQTVTLFFEILGQFAGDLALYQGALDGVYLTGGVLSTHADLLLGSRFRTGFENKGRHRSLMEAIPTLLLTHSQPGLVGAAACLRTRC